MTYKIKIRNSTTGKYLKTDFLLGMEYSELVESITSERLDFYYEVATADLAKFLEVFFETYGSLYAFIFLRIVRQEY